MSPETQNQINTGMCLWEQCLEWYHDEILDDYCDYAHFITRFRKSYGVRDTRRLIVNLVEPADFVYAEIGEQFCGSFDWEFIPWFLDFCIEPHDNGHHITLRLRDDWCDQWNKIKEV